MTLRLRAAILLGLVGVLYALVVAAAWFVEVTR